MLPVYRHRGRVSGIECTFLWPFWPFENVNVEKMLSFSLGVRKPHHGLKMVLLMVKIFQANHRTWNVKNTPDKSKGKPSHW